MKINVERPENMDEIMSQCFNPKYKNKKQREAQKYWNNQEKVKRRVFG